jgi:hypothetical protein
VVDKNVSSSFATNGEQIAPSLAPTTPAPSADIFGMEWQSKPGMPENFINDFCEKCHNVSWDGNTSKTFGGNEKVVSLCVSSIISLYKTLGNESKKDHERVLSSFDFTIHKQTVDKLERYSLTFAITPPLQVPFAVVLPTGSMGQQKQGGAFSWMCAGGAGAPPQGHSNKTIICISRDSVAVLPVSTDTIAQGETGLAPAALKVLKEQATKAKEANEANQANKLLMADPLAQAGVDVKDPDVGGLHKPTSLPPITHHRHQRPIAQVGAAGGGENGRPPAQGGGGGGEAKRGPGAGMNGSNPFTTDPASHHRQGTRKFAAFFLDPEKHANLLGYLALQTLFEPNTVDTQETQDNMTAFEPINSVSSRIIDALPTVTFYQALESDDKNEVKIPIFRDPTIIDENNPLSVDMSFDTRPWQEQYYFVHIDHLHNLQGIFTEVAQDGSTKPELSISRVPMQVSPGNPKGILNRVTLRFRNIRDEQGVVSLQQREELFHLFWNDSHDDSHPEKYLVAYSGRMQGTIDAIRNDIDAIGNDIDAMGNDPSHDTATEKYRQYMQYMTTVMAHQASSQPPGAGLFSGITPGVHYWKCPETTDLGYWHDHAHDILCDVDSELTFNSDLTKQRKLHNFILVIAKRLFGVLLPPNPQLTYKFESTHHRVVVGNEFHVIIRLENGQALIFYTGRRPPRFCDPTSQGDALNMY